MSEQITNFRMIAEIDHGGDLEGLNRRYKNMVSNTKKFNGSLVRIKRTKVANGHQSDFYHAKTGKLIRNISILSDRFGWEIMCTDFK